MREAMRYTLSLPVCTAIVGCDNIAQLEENAQIARGFKPLSQTEMASLNKVVASVARQSLFFHFETRPRDMELEHSG
jgi:predicted aldo/keto reductase-like oxidoreductase